VWNDDPYDNKSDIWSLGCVTYEMLTLHPPFRAESMEGLYQKVIKGQFGKINPRYSEDIFEMIKFLLKVNPVDRPNCAQILKHPLVVKRIEFFKEQEGFKDDDFDEMDEGKLLKTLRVTKNMLFLSEQLPDANYSPKNSKNMEKNKINNTINNTTKSTKNSLPNITSNSHYNATNEENTSESSNKMLNKYNIVENSSKSKLPVNKNLENKKVIIKPEKAITSVNNSNNITKKNYKEVLHSIDQELVNILPSHRLYQQKKPSIKKDKNVLRYLDGIGGNLYSRYAHQIETNKYTNNTNRNRVNLYHKHSNGNNPYLPSIYKNKYTNSVNKYAVKKKY
jgi:NIMA (never in mitosis gene a)-related kinase